MTRHLGCVPAILGLGLESCCGPGQIVQVPTGVFEVVAEAIPPDLGTDAMTVTVTDTTVVIHYENAEGSHEIVYDRSPLPLWPD